MSETYPGLVMTEQQQCQVKLESNFMPQARRKRDEVYGKGKRFVHYTSADAALKIIDSKRLWMRSTTCMSDYREVQHGVDILLHFFSNEEKKARFLSSLNACFPGVADEAIKMFDDYWRDTKANTYISSISEHEDEEDLHGRLSMWRAFGGNTARVALIFRIPFFSAAGEALNIIFSPVSYMEESKAHAEVETIIQNIQNHKEFICSIGRPAIVQTVFTMLYAAVACLKHPGFHEENEWRVIYGPNRYPSPLIQGSTEVVAGIPQLIYKLPLDVTVSPSLADLDMARIFDRLIIGPSPYAWAMFQAFSTALKKCGVADADERICISGIPIRP